MDDLQSKTDAELDELFAVEVVGCVQTPAGWHHPDGRADAWPQPYPAYCEDANAVIPFLAAHDTWQIWRATENRVGVNVAPLAWWRSNDHEEGVWPFEAVAPTLARAVVIVLIRAKRAALNPVK